MQYVKYLLPTKLGPPTDTGRVRNLFKGYLEDTVGFSPPPSYLQVDRDSTIFIAISKKKNLFCHDVHPQILNSNIRFKHSYTTNIRRDKTEAGGLRKLAVTSTPPLPLRPHFPPLIYFFTYLSYHYPNGTERGDVAGEICLS